MFPRVLNTGEGPRDASLAVVGRVRGDRIVLGVRVRDSDLVLGQDRIELETVDGVVVLPHSGERTLPRFRSLVLCVH